MRNSCSSCYNGTVDKHPFVQVGERGAMIARGRSGAVYEWPVKLGSFDNPWVMVAAKVIECGAKTFDALVKEHTRASALSHPHVVKVYGYRTFGRGEGQGGQVTIFMEKLEPLTSLVPRAWPEVRLVAHHVGAALAHIHGMDFVHGDVKPSDVLVDPSTNVFKLLADVGLSKALQQFAADDGDIPVKLCKPDTASVTHAAPEQEIARALNTAFATPATDVYAFGMTMARLQLGDAAIAAAGCHPRDDPELAEAFRACLEAPSTRPTASQVVEQLS